MARIRENFGVRLGRKQHITHEEFVRALENIERLVPRAQFERLFAQTVDEVAKFCAGKKVAYAWSGGKDSIALRFVCEAVGIQECVFGMSC
jgi:tRNA(Ile)-lysidine synthase TilS/MesJ